MLRRGSPRTKPLPKAISRAARRAAKAIARERQRKNPPMLRFDDRNEMSIHLAAWAGFSAKRNAKDPSRGQIDILPAKPEQLPFPHPGVSAHLKPRDSGPAAV